MGVTIYAMKRSNTVKRKPGSGRKAKLDLKVFKEMVEVTPLKMMVAHVRDLEVSETMIRRTVKKAGGKSLVRVERPLLTEAMKERHLHCCKTLWHDLKHAKAGRVIIFSDEKIWMVNPTRNGQNNCYLSFSDVDEAVCCLHPDHPQAPRQCRPWGLWPLTERPCHSTGSPLGTGSLGQTTSRSCRTTSSRG